MADKQVPFSKLVNDYELVVTGLIQVGACNAEELEDFQKLKLKKVIYIDANPLTMPELRRKVGKNAYHALVWSESGKLMNFHIQDFLACSSVWGHNPLSSNLQIIRTIDLVSTTLSDFLTANNLKAKDFNTLYVDVEGSELEVLKGADLTNVTNIYVEFQDKLPNTRDALVSFLQDFEVKYVEEFAHMDPMNGSWGNMLFVRK